MRNDSHLTETVRFIRRQTSLEPRIGIILGSGLGDFADNLPERTAIATSDIPHYPQSSVEGHKGRLVFATLDEKPILALQGRIHFYETNNLETVLYPIRVAREIGIKTLIVTNAAGGVNRTFNAGDLMVISDHINFTLQRMQLPAELATLRREVYSRHLIEKAEFAAAANGIILRKGVYVGLKGPSYETAAEIEMLTRMGGDAVGMSTVFEASLAAALGMEVLGISCITNVATGISSSKLSHAEVTDVGNRVKTKFATLVRSTIQLL